MMLPPMLSSGDAVGSQERPLWGLRDIAIGIAAAILLFVFLGLTIVTPLQTAYGTNAPGFLAGAVVAVALLDAGFVILTYNLARRRGASWSDLGVRSLGRDLFWITPIALIAAYGCLFLYGLVVQLTGLHFLEPGDQVPDGFFDHKFLLPLIGIAVIGFAPIGEELFFRGFIFSGLRRLYGLWPAAMISGFLFSLAHTDIGALIPFTAIGILLALAYTRTNSILTPMSIHLCFNLVSFLALVFIPETRN